MQGMKVLVSGVVLALSFLLTPHGQGIFVFLNIPAFLWFDFQSPTVSKWAFDGIPNTSNVLISSTNDTVVGLWHTRALNHQNKRIVLYLHGNGEHRGVSWNIEKYRMYTKAPFNADVVSMDYRGFGDSTFVWPTENGLYDDASSAYNYLLSKGFLPHDIVIHGYSLGSAVAVRLVYNLCKDNACPGGLLLEAPFTSISDVVQDRFFINLSALIHHRFATKEIIGDIPLSITIVHGTHDRVVPYTHGQSLATRFQSITLCQVEGAGHMNSLQSSEARDCVYHSIWRRSHLHCMYSSPSMLFQKRFWKTPVN